MRTLLFCLLLSSCAQTNKKPEIRFAAPFSAITYLPVSLAKSLGYFEQEGLDVHTEDLNSVTKIMESLIGGSVDIVGGTYEQGIQMAALGREVKSFFVLTRRYSHLLVVAPGRRDIRRIGDLKGQTVGVTAFGGSTNNFLNFALLRNGIKPADVDVVTIGNAASAIAAMESGKVHAAVMVSTPFEVLRNRHPDVTVLADPRTIEGSNDLMGTSTYAAGAIFASSGWLSSHPGEARRFARALSRAAGWIHEHPIEEVYAKLPESLRTPGSDADMKALRIVLPALTIDGRMPPGGHTAIHNFLKLAVDPSLNVGLSKTYTDEYLAAIP